MANIFKELSTTYSIKSANLSDIKFVRSHAQTIGQCQNLITENKFKTIISADTAGSAKDLSENNDKSIAAIASDLSAEIYNLKILKKKILRMKKVMLPGS